MKKFFRRLKVVSIDVHIYKMMAYQSCDIKSLEHAIEKSKVKGNKTLYSITVDGKIIHKSYLFPHVFLLRSIQKRGPVIGDCMTVKRFRGQSIYPQVINHIAKDVLNTEIKEVFVIVDKTNSSSIRGIEKAKFKKSASIKAKRWLFFYLKREITHYN